MKHILLAGLFCALLVPSVGEARWDVDRDDLDDDVVEDVYIPVLFYEADDMVPDFGASRGGGTRFHEGQDMLASRGTPIVSPTEAIVIRTGEGASAGKYVYTANPGGETFRYMHLDTIANLKHGDELRPGDFIGTVGDTGNAPDGVYHLHFEIRDEDNDPLDPYDRLTKEFSMRQQVSFLRDIFREIRNDEEYARFLVEEYPEVFSTAIAEDWSLPREVEEALDTTEVKAEFRSQQDLRSVLASIPAVLASGLEPGDDGVLVSLLQLFIMYTTDNEARDRLALAGPTGHYGPITAEAVRAYQAEHDLPETGAYDTRTRGEMLERAIVLNLN